MGNTMGNTTQSQGYTRCSDDEMAPITRNNKRRRTWSSSLKVAHDVVQTVWRKKQRQTSDDEEESEELIELTSVPKKPIGLKKLSTAGFLINGRYQVQEVVGKGSFGMVLKVTDSTNGSTKALKVNKNDNGASDMIKEAQFLEKLNQLGTASKHHVVELLGTFEWGGRCFLAMESLPMSLSQLLVERVTNPLNMDDVRNISYQILEALEYLAEHNIVHCDLKPSNIMLKDLDTLEIKIIDFGSSEPLSALTRYVYFTTRYYRSPEVMLGLKYSYAIDVWSMGCIMMELAIGDALFKGDNELDQMNRIVEVLGLPPISVMLQSTMFYKYFGRKSQSRRSGYFPLKEPGMVYAPPGTVSLEHFLNPDVDEDAEQDPRVSSSTDGMSEKRMIELAKLVLVYDATERITAAAAKNHALFQPLPRRQRIVRQRHCC